MSATDLKFVIFRHIMDGYRWRLSSASGETLELSERAHSLKAECEQEVYCLREGRYPNAKVRDVAIG